MIQVGFSTVTMNPFSAIVRKITGAKCSHTWLLLDDPIFEGRFVMEASDFGYRFISWEIFQAHNTIVAIIDPGLPLDAGVRLAGKWLGEWYDYTGLLGTLWPILGRWLKKKWKNPLQNPRALFCSEAVTKILQASNYPGAAVLDPATTTPQDLLTFLTHRS